ncbi:hypothetical protein BAZO_16689 [Schinkia azotoformans LMG 9581]|uniref:Uncharacterized protein n=1 Tax=Schinkia azotoformans LMG 9581 TaxID=1131731 RepID=K6D5J5_SCHAZ|nr:hypothetical protein BAZO_16689 [Schinkia azotoformans LMG 9581]
MNNKAFKGDKIVTPIFHPTSAIAPGNIIINNKCGLTARIFSAEGTGKTPNKDAPTVITIAVIVPSKQLNVEYRNFDIMKLYKNLKVDHHGI